MPPSQGEPAPPSSNPPIVKSSQKLPSRPRFSACLSAAVLALLPSASSVASAATAAHYPFENGTPYASIGDASNGAVLDVSGNGHHLHAFNNPTYSTTVPAPVVPRTAGPNTLSARFTGQEDIYSRPDDTLSRTIFTNFTIETYVRFDSLNNWQTLIGRDDANEGTGPQSLFYLSKTTDRKPGPGQIENAFRLELITKDNTVLMVESSFVADAGSWYHVAAVGDTTAGTLSLYVNGVLAGSTTGFTGLFAPSKNTAWTLGRGQYKNKPVDRLVGCLDEVRFSDAALPPSQFLNAPKEVHKPISLRKRFWRWRSIQS